MSDETQQADPASDEKRIQQLVAQWEGLLEQGQFIPAEELCADCPELLAEVRERIQDEGPTADEEGESADVGVAATVVEPDAKKGDPGALVIGQKYRRLTFLAKGGLGEVYVADDQDLRRDVAIKFIKSRLKNRTDCTEQFQLEAEITARLDHPGVVPVYGYGRTPDGRQCYAMRYIQGETMEERIARLHAPTKTGATLFSQERSVEFRGLLQQFITVCNTIAYAHNRGIIHRDIKPENIMLGKYDDTLVVDWGLAMTIDRDETARASGEATLVPSGGSSTSSSGSTGGPVGTPAYMSPEQARGEDGITASTDVFALGCTLYKILTGRPPYMGENARESLTKARYATFQPPQEVNEDIPAPLASICLKAMQADPADRYFTAIEMAYDLERYLANEPVLAYKESPREQFRRWRRSHSTLWHSAVSIVLLLAVSLTVYLTTAFNQQQALVAQRLEHLEAQGDFYNHVIVSGFDELRSDVLLLGSRPTVIQAALQFENGELDESLQSELESLFKEFLAQNPSYVQVRYIANDDVGMEKLRIDRSLSNPHELVIVPGSPKGERGYFTETTRLQRKQVYLSAIDINMEQGAHQWTLPVVRAGVPVFETKRGRVLGIIMINMAFEAIMDQIAPADDEDAAAPDSGSTSEEDALIYLTDELGRFLSFPGNDDVEFCFERRLDYRMEALFSELANFREFAGVQENRWTDATPRVGVLVAAHKPQREPDTVLSSKLQSLVRDEQFSSITVAESKYSDKDLTATTGNDARAMAILKANGSVLESDLVNRLTADLGTDYRVMPLPEVDRGHHHALYARKLYFDPTDKERFLCLLIVLPYE